jgi:uncharacterized protein YegJ (DUF2314 family)
MGAGFFTIDRTSAVTRGIVAGVIILAVLTLRALSAQTVTQKAERDEVAIVAKDDPVMAAAMRRARETLPDFLAIAAAPKPGMTNFAVKVAIHQGNDAEYFWIDPFANDNGRFSGRINNKPDLIHSVKLGQTITFELSEIVDWMYQDRGKMKGNYTACVLLRSAPAAEVAEFKERFGLDCDS